ncbi:MAG: triple tyrosine motif-containing protein, partial [Saprospiraceae bacterium]|nr:triple tyrosine motif-containing protein [Saprospiraceae bacterium]
MRNFIYLFLMLINYGISAQEYQFQMRRISAKDGLPNEYVRQALQDRSGFVWMATNYSVARFDGYQIIEIPEDGDFPPLKLLEDVNGMIWIQHFIESLTDDSNNILNIYNPSENSITPFDQKYSGISPFKTANIMFLFNDIHKNIWILDTDYNLYKYNGIFKKITRLPDAVFDKDDFYKHFNIIAQKGNIWIKTNQDHYLWRLDEKGNLEKIATPETFDQLRVDSNDNLWGLNLRNARMHRNIGNNKFEAIKLDIDEGFYNENMIWNIDNDRSMIWCALKDHLIAFDYNGKLIAKHHLNKNPEFRISYLMLMIDKYENIWVNSSHGVFIISLLKNRFTNYLDDGIKDVRDILVDEKGVAYVAQGAIHNLSNNKKIMVEKGAISIAKKGDIFWGCPYDGILSKKNIITGEFLSRGIDANQIKLFFSNTGRLWVGGKNYLATVDTATLINIPFTKYNNFASLKTAEIYSFYENKEGIWLLTNNGLYILDEEKGVVAHYGDQFPQKKIFHVLEDNDGIFWLATNRGGLLRWNRLTREVQQFTKRQGLSNDVIYSVYEDGFGYLWLSSQYGLMRFHKQTHQVSIYLPEDGIPHQEFNHLSHAQAPDGRLYFGGLGGVTSFYPKDFIDEKSDQTQLHPIAFDKLDGRNGQTKDYTYDLRKKQRIILYPHEKSFRLEFALLNYQLPQNNRYAYRIEALEKEWTYTKENYVRLNALPYGNYTLHIKAQKVNGQWSQHHLRIPVEVVKPIYLRWWFIALSIVFIILIIILATRERTRRLREETIRLEAEVVRRTATIERQAAELKIQNEQKSRFFLNVAHDLRTPLTFITS